MALRPCDVPEVNGLTIPEKIQFVTELWDTIAADETNIPVRPAHIEELERRLARQVESPEALPTWEEARTRIDQRLK